MITRTRLAHEGPAQSLVLDLSSTGAPTSNRILSVEGNGEGIPPAPSVTFDDGRRTAHLTVSLPRNRCRAEAAVTLIDGNRAAEFSVRADGSASAGSVP